MAKNSQNKLFKNLTKIKNKNLFKNKHLYNKKKNHQPKPHKKHMNKIGTRNKWKRKQES